MTAGRGRRPAAAYPTTARVSGKDEARNPRLTRKFFGKKNFDPEHDWRRIEADWLGTADQPALNPEGDTNDTSLVLALEFGDPGEAKSRFVGDARVGNRLSWADQTYQQAPAR